MWFDVEEWCKTTRIIRAFTIVVLWFDVEEWCKTTVGDYEYHKLKAQLAILEDVAKEYPTSSVPNAIQQIKSRIKHIEQNE